MSFNRLILCGPLLLPSIFPSIRVLSNESVLHIRWPKCWSFSFSIGPSHEHPGLISFRMDWLDLLAVHGTPKSLLQHHSSKASIVHCSAFLRSNSHIHTWLHGNVDYILQFSDTYMTTGKTISLTRWTFVSKVKSLLFNMLSRLLITFSKEQASFNFMATVTIHSDFGTQENKVCHCFACFPIYLPWSDWTRCHDLHFLNVEI